MQYTSFRHSHFEIVCRDDSFGCSFCSRHAIARAQVTVLSACNISNMRVRNYVFMFYGSSTLFMDTSHNIQNHFYVSHNKHSSIKKQTIFARLSIIIINTQRKKCMTLDLRINERLKLCIPNFLKSQPCMANKQTNQKKTEQNRTEQRQSSKKKSRFGLHHETSS